MFYINTTFCLSNLHNIHEAKQYFEKEHEDSYLAKTHYSLGTCYYYLADFKESLNCFYESLNLYQEIDDTVGQADAFNGIGSVYYEVKNYRDSILTLQKSFDLIEDYKSNNILAKVLHGLGEATYHLGNFKKSKDYFLQCIKLCEEHGFKQVSVFANEGMANIYFNQKNKEKQGKTRKNSPKKH